MPRLICHLLLFICFSCGSTLWAQDSRFLPRSTPEEQGVSSADLLSFLDAIEAEHQKSDPAFRVHSFMLIRNGHVVAEGWWNPYARERRHMLYSLSKSFTSTAVGLAVEEGLITLDDRVVSFFPDNLPDSVSANLAAMRVRDLLTMAAGNENEGGPDSNWVRGFLAQPVVHEPGTHFRYSTRATFMLSAIIQQVTGENLHDYLRPRLFEPLGIMEAAWDTNPQGIDVGGSGLHLRTEDIAKLGLLYLQKGKWNAEQLIPADWVAEATAMQIPTRAAYVSDGEDASQNDWAQGYGYKFWQTTHGAYRGDGAFGQFSIVLPELNAVVAITSGSRNMQAVMNAVWDHLLPAFRAEPLPEDMTTWLDLQAHLASLTLLPSELHTGTPMAETVSGQVYQIEENDLQVEQVSLLLEDEACLFTLHVADEAHHVPCGIGSWVESHPSGNGSILPASWLMASTGRWLDEDTFEMIWQFVETPYRDTVTLDFEDDGVSISFSRNVGFGNEQRPELHGKMAP